MSIRSTSCAISGMRSPASSITSNTVAKKIGCADKMASGRKLSSSASSFARIIDATTETTGFLKVCPAKKFHSQALPGIRVIGP